MIYAPLGHSEKIFVNAFRYVYDYTVTCTDGKLDKDGNLIVE